MIKASLPLLLTLCSLSQLLPAQEWAPPGTRWYYSQYSFGGPNIGLHVMEVVGDTTINNRACRIIEGGQSCSFPMRYAYREDRRIYYYNEVSEDFALLYDFNLVAGDTLKMFVADLGTEDMDTFYVRIDSLSQLRINNDSVQVQHVTPLYNESFNAPLSFGRRIYEDIGGDHFFLPPYGFCDVPAGPLRCFEHPDFGVYQFLTEFPCDYVPVRERFSDLGLNVYPNPAGDQILIATPGEPFTSLDIFDLNGLRLYSQNNIFATEIRLALPDLPAGIYLIKARLRDGTIGVQRFFKT
ncbi:T9SS type A sorting domain-containing protein [Flavilitoribacter nigricans]|uniref:Secretion system C-terminal sorting domain-containing protein n=1 Tax=Flavilitoribacter nigricans (strain ATCC 23147 / DSM 23189 / NBRC 102662 / NCIMB 1420 / SS-2) TaxID=1122177 RepID=A0A2D0MX43_FLAN2|nr:T9SS type A sorting domain-containing protein [Flavilitoribacter nigricans]PHN00841.1 hypothetical protein CRP01_40105 [Flavilitoribacter nigricans DSM 23189 = NBRC 102662]